MKSWLTGGWFLVLLLATGCGGEAPRVSGSTAPITEDVARQIAEEDKRIDEEESPGNKTRQMLPN